MLSGKKTHHLLTANCKSTAISIFLLKELMGTLKNIFTFHNVTNPRTFYATDKIIVTQEG